MKNILKKFLFATLLFLFPLASLVLVGIIYVIARMIGGMELLAAVSSFNSLIYSLMPYFPYLTIIPVVLVLSILFFKHLSTIKKWNNSRDRLK